MRGAPPSSGSARACTGLDRWGTLAAAGHGQTAYPLVSPPVGGAAQLRSQREHLFHTGQRTLRSAPCDSVQVMPEAEPNQMRADELAGGQPTPLFVRQLPYPYPELEGHPLGIRPLIDTLPMQDVPDHHQQLPCERDDRLLFANPAREALKFALPVRMGAGGGLCRLDQHPPQLASAFLGNPPGPIGFAAGMHPRSQSRIADELLGSWEARDVPNRRQQDHRGDQPDPRELDQLGHLVRPQGAGAQPMQLGLDGRDLLRQMVEGGQILIDAQPLSHAQFYSNVQKG